MLNCTSKNFSTHTLWFGNDTVASWVNWEHAGSGTRVSVWSQFYKTIKINNSKFWSSKFLSFCFNLFVLLFIFSFVLFFVPPECFLVRSGLVSGLTNDLLIEKILFAALTSKPTLHLQSRRTRPLIFIRWIYNCNIVVIFGINTTSGI